MKVASMSTRLKKKSFEQRLKEWEIARFAPAPESDLAPFSPSLTEMVVVRDGIALYTEIFLPLKVEKRLPAILLRSPYPYSRPSRHEKIRTFISLESSHSEHVYSDDRK